MTPAHYKHESWAISCTKVFATIRRNPGKKIVPTNMSFVQGGRSLFPSRRGRGLRSEVQQTGGGHTPLYKRHISWNYFFTRFSAAFRENFRVTSVALPCTAIHESPPAGGLWYLASPYSKYPAGLDAAFQLACQNVGLLIQAGVPAYSPIAHTHPVAMACGLDPLDHAIWLPADEPMMRAASGLIMLTAESWEISYGMRVEREFFECAGKPIVWMTPGRLPDFRSREAA